MMPHRITRKPTNEHQHQKHQQNHINHHATTATTSTTTSSYIPIFSHPSHDDISTKSNHVTSNTIQHVHQADISSPPCNSLDRVPSLLRLLVHSILSNATSASLHQQTQLCMRILSSRIGAYTNQAASLTTAADALAAAIFRTHPMANSSHVNELLHGFMRQTSINDKQRIVTFLTACQGINQTNSVIRYSPSFSQLVNQPIHNVAYSTSSTVPMYPSQPTQIKSFNSVSHSTNSSYDARHSRPTLSGGGRHLNPAVLPDQDIVRALLYVFQGIDSQIVRFDRTSRSYRICDGVIGISSARKQLIIKICDIGILYRRVCAFMNDVLGKRDKQNTTSSSRRVLKKMATNVASSDAHAGLICQSLVGALQRELGDYYRWIAMLETQLNESPQTLTLRRLYISSQSPFRRLVQLTMLVDEASTQHGGSILSLIYSHCQHGDVAVRNMMRLILDASSSPLLGQIDRWLQTGEVIDPHEEFFVAVNLDAHNDKLWTDKYYLRMSMIPSFISPRMVHEILVVGKSVNFIRQCCDQPQFTAQCTLSINDLVDVDSLQLAGRRMVSSSDPSSSSVSQTLLNSAMTVNNHLLSLILGDQHQLMLHTGALKSFLLLAQGDFIQSLFDVIANDLNKPANTLNIRSLQVHVDVAVRGSNARFASSDVLRRLGVKLLRGDGDSGWDVFSLDYAVEAPLSVIITPDQMRVYLRLFNFLWRLKRVEYELVNLWSRHMSCRSIISKSLGSMPAYAELERVLRVGHFMRNELHHLVKNVHSFMMLEVIESSYQSFTQAAAQAQSLDAVILAHDQYVTMLAEKALLQGPSAALSKPLLTLFDDAMKFVRLQDRIYDEAMREVAKREIFAVNAQRIRVTPTQTAEVSRRESFNESQQHEIKERMSKTSAAADNAAQLLDSGVFVDLLPAFESDVLMIEDDFHDHLYHLVDVLDQQIDRANHAEVVNQDDQLLDGPHQRVEPNSSLVQELEFLRFRLDFSEFYARRGALPHVHNAELSPHYSMNEAYSLTRNDSHTTSQANLPPQHSTSHRSRANPNNLRQHDEYL